MKAHKLILSSISSILLVCSFEAYSQGNGNGQSTNNGQGNTMWLRNGNTADQTDYIGTNNSQDLVLKAGNNEVIRINPLQDARFKGGLILENEIDPQNQDGKFLKVGADGRLVSAQNSDLLRAIYGNSTCGILGDNQTGTLYESPIWQSIPVNSQYGYLITGIDCPARVGIGFNEPRVSLDVNGTTFSRRIALGSANPIGQSQYFSLQAPFQNINHNYTIFEISNMTRSLFELNNNGVVKTIDLLNSNELTTAQLTIDITNYTGTEPVFVINDDTHKLLQLDETGLLRTRAIKVNVYQWPDYVFEDGYSLMDLDSLDRFIQVNNHLPNVPEANEMESQEQDIYEMNKLLMEKIEELTLYIIDQNKRIKLLENENQ